MCDHSSAESLTPFIGRDDELQGVGELAGGGSRLITIFGPAGIGKTRLAGEYLRRRINASEDSVFCDLRAAHSAREVCESLAQAVETRIEALDDASHLVDAVGRALAARAIGTVVLDNVEQLVGEIEQALHAWLRRAPDTTFLVTSRRALRLQDEQLVELNALPLPQVDDDWEVASMRLFEDRARRAEPSFDRSSLQARSVAPLIRRLEGIPLAIELAAGQMRYLSVVDLLAKYGADTLSIPNNVEDRDPRHNTLRSAIECSWKLLDPAERDALGQLTVFRNGFTLPAAEGVLCLSETTDTVSGRAVLARLRDASLLRLSEQEDPTGGLRWDLYEAVREFANQHVAAPSVEAAQRRHATHFATWSEALVRRIEETHDSQLVSLLTAEVENLRSAATFQLARKCTVRTLRLAYAAHLALRSQLPGVAEEITSGALAAWTGPLDEPNRLKLLLARAASRRHLGDYDGSSADLDDALKSAKPDTRLAAELALETGWLAYERGDVDQAENVLNRTLAGARRLGSRHLEARVRVRLAWLLAEARYSPDAFDHYSKAVEAFVSLGDRDAEVATRVHWSAHRVFFQVGDPIKDLVRLVEKAREGPSREVECHSRYALGIAYQDVGLLSDAAHSFRSAGRLAARYGFRRLEANTDYWLGKVADESGDAVAAESNYIRAAAALTAVGERRAAGVCYTYLAGLIARGGDPERARSFLKRATGMLERTGDEELLAGSQFQRVHIALAEARVADARGQNERANRLRSAAARRVAMATEGSGAMNPADAKAQRVLTPHRSEVSRFVLRLFHRTAPTSAVVTKTLFVYPDSSGFQLDSGPMVDIPQSPVAKRLLSALVEARAQTPGRVISHRELFEVGWPGERISAESAFKRVSTAIWRLRQLGLRDVLITGEAGYLLAPEISLQRGEASEAE